MNTVFLIGNGFDLNLGLRTRFSDFYKHYYSVRKEDKREHIQKLLKDINGNAENWSYLEKALGEYAEKFSPDTVSDFTDIWHDIIFELAKYIKEQQELALPTNIHVREKEKRYLAYPELFIKRALRQPYQQFRETYGADNKISIINFNYTSTFEEIYGWEGRPSFLMADNHSVIGEIENIYHIHGTTTGDMILGVDNTNQILSQNGLQNHPEIVNRMVKPTANEHSQTLRDTDCKNLIADANLICVFGMSLGITDQTWWKYIYDRLKSDDAMAIIFSKDSSTDPLIAYLAIRQQEKKVQEFLKAAGVSPSNSTSIKEKIAISFNSDIFSSFSNIAEYPLF